MEQKPAYLRGGRGRGVIKKPEESIGNGRGPSQIVNDTNRLSSGIYKNNVNNSCHVATNNIAIPWGSRDGKVTNDKNVSSKSNSNITTSDEASSKRKQSVKNDDRHFGIPSENVPKPGEQRSTGEEIFRAASAQHQEAAKRQISSSAADDFLFSDEDEDDDFDQKKDAVMSNLIKKLNDSASSSAVGAGDLGRTAKYIEDALKSKSNVCLICIESVSQADPVWNCCGCYTMFHIQCIQQWIREGVQHKSVLSSEHFPNKDRPWFCPKCRHEYQQTDFPKLYVCFCGKESNPTFDPWLVPHSCGRSCGKRLKPDCGHQCLLQCHPGPCPPCPKTVRSKCFCGKSSEQVRRCGVARWSCGLRCGRPMNCGHHSCPRPCHDGECGDCPQTSQQSCVCRKNVAVVQCASPQWKCEQVCNKQLSCNHHKCQIVCHSGSCPPCPKDGKRKCPCGKTTFDLPCTEEAPTCLETCDKLLECGLHRCTSRCHQGPCGMCREMTRKKCRCGKREKELQCFKEFQCEIKCTTLKDCGVHQCKRKCCDGTTCPPCTAMCGKPLKCRQHKCANTCHLGPCYPCTNMAVVKCNCGKTTKSVPCGTEKKTKPPKCNKPCSNPPNCHHPSRTPHSCHFGECSKCVQTCSKQLIGCSHSCPAPCHSAVKVEVKDTQPRAGPWEVREPKRFAVVCQPCPPCVVPVKVTCFGGHETSSVNCSESEPTSCQRPCGRSLSCGNHVCQLPCHVVEGVDDDPDKAGTNCTLCEEACAKPRPPGCTHSCLLPCHPGQCPPCSQMIKMRCHCKMVVKHVPCMEWCKGGGDGGDGEDLRSCGCRCPRLLPCTHQCRSKCHSGDCPPVPDCSEKVKVRCSCGRRREELSCHVVQSGEAKVECNKSCEVEKEKARKAKEASDLAASEVEAQKRREELEEFDRRSKVNSRRKRQRKQDMEEDNDGRSMLVRNKKAVLAAVMMIVLALFAYKLLSQV